MFCPSCGAPNNDRDQRYCRQCGTSLPVVDPTGRAAARGPARSSLPAARPPASGGSLISSALNNRLAAGAVVAVVAVVALYVAIHLVLGIITSLIPVILVLGAIYLGFLYWRRGKRR